MYAQRHTLRRAISAATVALAIAVAGCGGSSNEGASKTQRVTGPGFTFEAPTGRAVKRSQRSVAVLPADQGSAEIESATRFRLVKSFKPSLWPKAIVELDGVAERLATSLGGTVESKETISRGGVRGRRYELAYEREGVALRQRLSLLLRKRTEYQLLCRWSEITGEPEACALLERTFALA